MPTVFARGTAADASFLVACLPLIDPLHPDPATPPPLRVASWSRWKSHAARAPVQPALSRVLGVFPGWLATAALDTAASDPATLLLADARVGLNVVFVAFAAITSIATGWLRVRADRVPPPALSRALAAWP